VYSIGTVWYIWAMQQWDE